MRPVAWMILLFGLAPVLSPAEAQVPPRGDRAQMEAAQERRAQLERQVRHRFLAHAAERLQLDDRQRQRLHALLERGAEERMLLARESRALRMELMQAVRADRTPRPTFERLLLRLTDVREREVALERREAAEMATFLEPRQQAMFLVLRMELNEQVRGMRRGPPGEGRRGPGGP